MSLGFHTHRQTYTPSDTYNEHFSSYGTRVIVVAHAAHWAMMGPGVPRVVSLFVWVHFYVSQVAASRFRGCTNCAAKTMKAR
jgi:hypothetical protein